MRMSDWSSDVCSSDLRQSDMQTALGISAATVSRVIGNIARAREKEIRHRSHERSTRKSPLFAPRMIKDGSGPLMDMLRGQALTGRLSNVLGTDRKSTRLNSSH